MLKVCGTALQHAVIHFENGSGGRVGIFNDLKMKHIFLITDNKLISFEKWMPDVILSNTSMGIVGYADEKEEYYTYLPPEGTGVFFTYVKNGLRYYSVYDAWCDCQSNGILVMTLALMYIHDHIREQMMYE